MDRPIRSLPKNQEVNATYAPKTDGAMISYLRAHGWVQQPPDKRGRVEWRHRNLTWPWSATAAHQLQRETNEGMMDPAHRLLRGED